MNAPAAFQATFTDWRLVKGRKVVQVVFEVPLEAADGAYSALGGMPDPGKSIWCAIARLNPEAKEVVQNTEGHSQHDNAQPALAPEQPVRAPRPFSSLPLPQQAALLCHDPVFRSFLAEEYGLVCEDDATTAVALRSLCNVGSRRDLRPDNNEGRAFIDKREQFLAWKLVAA